MYSSQPLTRRRGCTYSTNQRQTDGLSSLNHQRCQHGASLIEILVTLFVLAIGLLGIFALQIQSLKLNQDGYMHSVATIQAYSMLDRIRANRTGASAGSYDGATGIPSDPGCTTCSPTQLAQQDIRQWNQLNAQLLPSGQGTIARSSNTYTITIMWDEMRTGVTGTGCSGDSSVDLNCLIINAEL